MSLEAKRWAALQEGLSPAEERVLRVLASFHSVEKGCFPTQKTLMKETGISASSLNANLKRLENRGLITRTRRRNPTTGNIISTYYELHFHVFVSAKKAAAPSPVSGVGGLRNPETSKYSFKEESDSLVSTTKQDEGTPFDDIVENILANAGPGLCQDSRKMIRSTDHILRDVIEAGVSVQDIIIPIVRSRTRRRRKEPIITWNYFTRAFVEAHEAKTGEDLSFLCRGATAGPPRGRFIEESHDDRQTAAGTRTTHREKTDQELAVLERARAGNPIMAEMRAKKARGEIL